MSLLQEIEAVGSARGPVCGVAMMMDDLDPADRADLETAFASVRYRGAAISKALAARGIKIAAETIQRHRRGDCRCPKHG